MFEPNVSPSHHTMTTDELISNIETAVLGPSRQYDLRQPNHKLLMKLFSDMLPTFQFDDVVAV